MSLLGRTREPVSKTRPAVKGNGTGRSHNTSDATAGKSELAESVPSSEATSELEARSDRGDKGSTGSNGSSGSGHGSHGSGGGDRSDDDATGRRAGSRAEKQFNKVLRVAVDMNLIGRERAKRISRPKNEGEILTLLREEGIEDHDLSRLLSEFFGWELYNEETHGYPDEGRRGSNWLIANETAFVADPFGHTLQEVVERYGRHFKDYGILPLEYMEETGHVESAEERSEAEKWLKKIMGIAIDKGASDVHIDPYKDEEIHIKMRIDGHLQLIDRHPKGESFSTLANIILSYSGCETGYYKSPRDGQFAWPLMNRNINIRMAMSPVVIGNGIEPKFVLRLLGLDTGLADLDKLGLEPDVLNLYKSMAKISNGLVLVTGPTGSGKTNTLFALLRQVAKLYDHKSIFTVEDPVEIEQLGFHQIQVNPEASMTFAAALKSLLRLDPDVMLVGEVRDSETASLSMRAALTGHLVFSTLHTNSAIGAIPRLIDMDLDRGMLSQTLRHVTAQRLLRQVCQRCSEVRRFGEFPDFKETYKHQDASRLLDDDEEMRVANKEGCNQCQGGYKGRQLVNEVLTIDKETEEKISRGESIADILRYQRESRGYADMWDDGLRLVREGATTFFEMENVLDLR